MLSLDSPAWQHLLHAYGPATDIPGLLRQLEESPGPHSSYKDEPWYSLWSSLCHQGDVYTASYAAVPHILRIALLTKDPIDPGFFQLPACVEIARASSRGPALQPDLADAYLQALNCIPDCVHAHSSETWDEGMMQCVAAALAVSKGHSRLAEAIVMLDSDMIDKIITLEL
jgi:hypothetical protein